MLYRKQGGTCYGHTLNIYTTISAKWVFGVVGNKHIVVITFQINSEVTFSWDFFLYNDAIGGGVVG